MTLPYTHKCCIFPRSPSYMYITLTYSLCSTRICSTTKFKSTTLLCTHVYSYLLRKVHSPGVHLTVLELFSPTCIVQITGCHNFVEQLDIFLLRAHEPSSNESLKSNMTSSQFWGCQNAYHAIIKWLKYCKNNEITYNNQHITLFIPVTILCRTNNIL